MSNSNKASISVRGKSGINITTLYSEMLVKAFSYDWSASEGDLLRTNQILIEYLYALEESDLEIPNYDLYISFSIEIANNDLLPLFNKKDLQAGYNNSRDFQYICLTQKIIMQLFIDLSEKLLSTSGPNRYKLIIHQERLYIENVSNLISNLLKKRSFRTVDTVAYQSVYDTLLSCFAGIPGKLVSSEKIRNIIRNIGIRNNELNMLITGIVKKMEQ